MSKSQSRAVQRVSVDGVGKSPAYSHAAIASGLIFLSGSIATIGGAFKLLEGDVSAQTTQALTNMEKILSGMGSEKSKIAKCNVYLTDMTDFDAMNKAYLEFFGDIRPARTTVAVAALPLGALVEIECVAVAPLS